MQGKNDRTVWTKSQFALLRSESPIEYEQFWRDIYEELKPDCRIERDLADDVVAAMWECKRLRGFGAAIINGAFLPALRNVLAPTSMLMGIETDELAKQWFENNNRF